MLTLCLRRISVEMWSCVVGRWSCWERGCVMLISFDGQYETALEVACRLCNLPRNRRLYSDERFELAEWVLDYLGFGGSTFGVEYCALVQDDSSSPAVWYLNAGDTYDATILCEDDGRDFERRPGGLFFVSSWGDWYEGAEAERCEAEGEVRCGYCSAFTPLADDVDWRDTRCESCGRNVSTGEVMAEAAAADDEDE